MVLGCNIVCVLQSSGQWWDLFDEIVQDGNEKGWFQAGTPPAPVKLPLVQLLHDMVTQ